MNNLRRALMSVVAKSPANGPKDKILAIALSFDRDRRRSPPAPRGFAVELV